MKTYTNKYETTLAKASKKLERYGVCVIPNILNQEECTQCIDNIWSHLEYASSNWEVPIRRKKAKTWNLQNFGPTKAKMLLQHLGVGHCRAAWDIRQNPKVTKVFATLHNCKQEDLITSFDGISISMPPEKTGDTWPANTLWLHADSSYVKPQVLYQSWVTPIDVNTGDATLVFMAKSHRYVKKVADKFDIEEDKQWNLLSKEQISYYKELGCEVERITCKAGSIVLWDSRLIHCGGAPYKTREQPNFRFCIYVCMADRNTVENKKKLLKRRVKYFEDMELTSHNPLDPNLFSKKPKCNRFQKIVFEETLLPKPPVLTELGKSLVGYH